MSKNRGYSNEFQLCLLPASFGCQVGLINEVKYADGTVRKVGYDEEGVANHFVEIDGRSWNREAGTQHWTSDTGADFDGVIEVVPQGSKDNVAGSITIRVMDGGFVVTERILFPIGIVVESKFARDRTELEREVKLLNGKQLKFHRQSRHGLWFRQDGDIAHQPENASQYGTPWRHPAVATALL
ncbi:MAG: hypothetical protein SGJ27_21095 [Candidatus Melainabacteria bacterium]|nr:hypothetical protein [Candidatus Melainabacteria bacterium]